MGGMDLETLKVRLRSRMRVYGLVVGTWEWIHGEWV